ncbi:hypothetical protein ABVT39_023444 [Epinephelus coioides]
MENDDNITQVKIQLNFLRPLHLHVTSLHSELMDLIPLDEQSRQNEWFANINNYNNGFTKDVEHWLSENDRLLSRQKSNEELEGSPSQEVDEHRSMRRRWKIIQCLM